MGIFYSTKSPDEIEDEIIELDSQIDNLRMQIMEIESDIDGLECQKSYLEQELDMINEMIEDLD